MVAKKKDLREICREKYGNDFVELYDCAEGGNMICTDCYWYEEEQAYCLRLGCHVCEEQDCKLWEPPKEET